MPSMFTVVSWLPVPLVKQVTGPRETTVNIELSIVTLLVFVILSSLSELVKVLVFVILSSLLELVNLLVFVNLSSLSERVNVPVFAILSCLRELVIL